ncbi:DNA topoisomerase III [Bacillus lacus]|uniref:DNA topoisomerase n=1 Tax=Metabacillus lacus TaxID=1983721 RepID=A0A7X2LZ03_9BACI|nr:DNA topoisomerase III [Metabacillus lacus]MRX72921.1 DNA topoisomerase III [Metabacillus lacus]
MILIIAEKPDQGKTLSSPFKNSKKDGYIEIEPNHLFPEGAYCTWAIGHLTSLSAPEAYHPQWKKWTLASLPILPEKFQYEVTKSKYKQFQVIKTLLKKPEVTQIIHAGDAGREGELIIRNIIQLSGVRKPMKRLWISSLTPKAILQGFQNLKRDEDTLHLYYEAYSRACADWLVGMNASRVYSILLKQQGMNDVFSAGRVQTPTLALIVNRENEIDNFKAETFWEVLAHFDMDGKVYSGKWSQNGESRIKDAELAEKIAAFCRNKHAQVKHIEKERKEYQPPLLFNLSSLQAAANQAFKYSPKKTLDIAQSLYQKGIISYPRSDSNYVGKGEAEAFPAILKKLSAFNAYSDLLPAPNSILHNRRFVNESKVTDHYAIIPTEQVRDPEKLNSDENKIYDMIIRRLISAHYESAIFDYSTLTTIVEQRAEFITKGKQQIREGWRKVIYINKEDDDVLLPAVAEKDEGYVSGVQTKEGKTQPPKRYTEGQLITLMKTAGKHLDNEELEKVLSKTEGLGTEATRAGIITMLKDRKYIQVVKNTVYPTDKGKVLIKAIGSQILSSPEMTAKWEQRLAEIGEGKASPAAFMEQTKKLSEKIVSDALSLQSSWDFKGMDTEGIQRTTTKYSMGKKAGACVKCGGSMVDKGDFYGCSNYKSSKCSFTISKLLLGKKISLANAGKLLKGEQTNLIKGFKKDTKTFDARLQLEDGKLKFIFPNS